MTALEQLTARIGPRARDALVRARIYVDGGCPYRDLTQLFQTSSLSQNSVPLLSVKLKAHGVAAEVAVIENWNTNN